MRTIYNQALKESHVGWVKPTIKNKNHIWWVSLCCTHPTELQKIRGSEFGVLSSEFEVQGYKSQGLIELVL